MLKRIPTTQLRPGMYVQELCGSWISNPFWRSSFKLNNLDDLNKILAAGITEAWIDTSKGVDVAEDESPAETGTRIDDRPHEANKIPGKPAKPDTSKDVGRAVKIFANSRHAISSMFQEARMGKALDEQQARPIVEEISAAVLHNPGALMGLARLKRKDDYTYMHSVAVCALMVSLAHQLDMSDDEVRQAGMAGMLHDIGKMMVPLEILNKPAKLTDEEFLLIKNHTVAGHEMLLAASSIDPVSMDVCLHHHERFDGSGYPEHLDREHISTFSRMCAICDVYDAITSNRPYKDGWEPSEAIRKMAEWSASHFDPVLFQAFVKDIGIYPIGTLVKLSSNRLAVVVQQSTKSLLTPTVKVFFSIKSNCRITPELLDLSWPSIREKIVSHEDPKAWDIADILQLWSGLPDATW
jgi:putative nucleotidyltransferase with HDIG domain